MVTVQKRYCDAGALSHDRDGAMLKPAHSRRSNRGKWSGWDKKEDTLETFMIIGREIYQKDAKQI